MTRLKNILRINAISSGVTGLILVLMPHVIAPLMGLEGSLPLTIVGVFLLGFSIFVYGVSLRSPAKKQLVEVIIVLDTAWVVGSVVALLFLLPVLSIIGNAAIILVAIWVAGMAMFQKKGLPEAA